MKKVLLSALLLISSVLPAAHAAGAADYPSRNIRFVVPFTPGTGMDRIARKVGEHLHAKWGQAVVVDTRTGAAGHIGAQMVAQSPADGYTVVVTASNISITSTLFLNDKFDAMRDLDPLLIAAYGDSTLMVNPKAKFNTLPEFIAAAKSAPGKITFATPGTGSPQHIAMALFEEATGVKFLHVPYKGTAPAVTDLIAGHVDAMFVATHTVMPFIKAGQLKPIAVGAQKRNPFAPEIPSFAESGVTTVSTQAWYGFMLPKGVPADIKKKLRDEIATALEIPEIKDDLKKFGLDVRPSTSEEMRKIVMDEHQRYAAIIKQNNIVGTE